MRQHFSG